jgi:hypothetical protein
MRCYICNAKTQGTEIFWEESTQSWSPCTTCVGRVREDQEVALFDGLRTQETPAMPKLRKQ